MHPPRLRSDVRSDIFQERNHVVIGSFLNFENLGNGDISRGHGSLWRLLPGSAPAAAMASQARISISSQIENLQESSQISRIRGREYREITQLTLKRTRLVEKHFLNEFPASRSPNPCSDLATVIHQCHLPRSKKISHRRGSFLL